MTQPTIPHIIHQTWRTSELSPELIQLRQTWLDHHPHWEYHLWTDEENRALVAAYYPWFLPTYEAYPLSIMRADTIRYMLLHHYGGLYIDLDYLCLRPVDALLVGQAIVLGLEPEAHAIEMKTAARGFNMIVGNAFMASHAGHPFWEHVMRGLLQFRDAPSVLDATGPFFLTRAYHAYPARDSITLLPASVVTPLSWRQSWAQDMTPDGIRTLAGDAHAVHLWHGAWRREEVLTVVQAHLRAARATSSPSEDHTDPGQTEA